MASAAAAESKVGVPIVCPGHSRPLAELHYSPVTEDGLFLISACLDKKPMLRNGTTGDWIGTFAGHKGAVWSAKLNKPATLAATGSADFSVKIWDAITGKEWHTFDHKHIVKTVDFSQEGKKLLSGGHEKKVRIFNLDSLKTEATIETPDIVRKALWTPDGNCLLAGLDSNSIVLYDSRSKETVMTMETAGKRVMDMEFSRDNDILTVASGKKVQFFDVASWKLIKEHTMEIEIEAASLHHEGKFFVAGGEDMAVRLYDFETGDVLETHKGHHGPVHCLRFSPTGKTYTSGANDSTIRMWQSSKLK